MPTFEELRRSKYGDSTPQPEEESDESTVPVEERLPAPYEDAGDIMVSELLDQNPQLTTEQQESSEEFTSEQWFGLALGTGVELTTPIAGNIAYLKWLNRAKAAAKATRGLKATPLGLLGLGAGEVILGGLSNVANQKIQLHYKSQKKFKISEVMAAGVFNASPVVKVIDGLPVFKFLQPKTGSKFAYRNIITKTGEKLVSGAAIGLLESAFRQSVSGLLQEEELFDEAGNVKEGVYRDLLVSAGVGATLNTAMHGGVGLFSYWRTKGKAGRAEAVKLTDLMDGDLVKQIDDINKEIQATAADVGIFTNIKEKNAKIAALKKKKKQVEEAKQLNQQLKEEIQEENARVDEAEANPKPIEEEQTLTEEELDKPDENLREYTEEDLEVPKERQPVEEPEVKVEEEVVEEPTTPVEKVPEDIEPTSVKDEEVVAKEPEVVEEPKKPEAAPKPKILKRDNALQSLIDRTKAAFSGGDVPTIEGANIIREGKKLYDNSISIFTKAIHTFREGGNKDVRALQIALDEVVFLRKLNQKVSDPLSTLVGRGLQSHRQDAAKYDYQTVLSERAGAESDAWSDVEKSLRQTIENEADVSLFKNIQDALDVRPRFKRLGQELDRQATQDFKNKLREATEKEPKEIPQEVIISRLQKKLREAQEEFAGLRSEQKAKKGKEKSQEEIDIQNRLDFYATGKREAKQIAQEEAKLETYLELLEEGDLAKIRQEVGPAPDWANKKEVGSYLAKIRQVNNRTKKLLQKQVVESDISLQDPKKVAKAQAKQKAQLEKRLKELQKRFGDINKIRPKDKPKKAEADAEIEDLKNRIKFHEANEGDALKLEAALKERARLLKVETGPLGQQRAEITKPKGPTKVSGELEKVNEDINFLKKNIKSRVKEIDKAALEITDEFQAAKAEAEINKQLSKLDEELEELRSSFAKEPVEPGVKKPKDKDPRVKEKEDKIAYYKEARQQIITLKKKLAERDRLLKLETGPLGAQRAEVTPKPTGPKKSEGVIADLDKDIAFLRSNMRKRVDEIDRAKLEMDEAFQEAKMLESIRKRRAIAQKRLDERRERFADDTDLDRRAAERAGRNIEETDPVLVETQEKIKFYDELEAEALKKKQLKEELAKRAEMEGRGIVSEMRAHLAPKPTGPQKVRSTDKIRQEIRDSDKRMRDKLKDIDAAQDSFREERIYESVRKQAMLAAQRDVETKLSRFFKGWGNNRVYSMIWQTSSVLASALGGISSTFKQFAKLGTEPIADLMFSTKNYRGTQVSAWQVLKANAYGLREGLKNWKGTGRAVAMTAKNLESATGAAGGNRLTGDISLGDPIKLLEAAEEQARRKRLRGEDIKGVQHIFARMPIGKMFNEFMKLPLRGIMPIDELFRRQLLRSELMAEAWKDAFDAIPNDPKKASELAADLYKQKWTKDQGLEILSQEGVNSTATDTINKELLFDSNVANLDPSEIAQPISDKVLKFVKELKLLKDNPAIGTFIHLLAPIMTVVARGAGRSIRVGVPIIPTAQAARNPYNHRIKKVEGQIRDKDNYIAHEETTPQRRQELQKEKEELEQKIKELKGRRIAYHRDAITDTLMGSGMMAAGYGMGGAGVALGTLAWMTPEQRKKFEHKNPKAKANTIEGWGYREFFPLSIAFAIGADIANYDDMKEFTDEDGKPILTKKQNRLGFLLRSITELFKEVPVAGGMKSIEKIMSGESEQINSVLADWLGSFGLVPSQVNKVLKLYFEKGSVEELKGGDIQDRLAYKVVGHNPTGNKKTDHFGHDMQSPKTLLNTFIRWAPDRSQELNAFDEVYKKDIEGDGQLIKPPTQFPEVSGIDMYKFVDNNGVSLHYRFNQEVKKLNVDKLIIDIVKDKRWRKAWLKGSRKRTGTADLGSVSNPALQKLNTKFRLAYERAAKNIMKNKALLNEFISEEENKVGTVEYDKYGKNKTLKQAIDLARGQSVLTGKPISVEEVLGRNDLEELLQANPQMQRTD
uniref:Uncharacterized protein n=1 Tax=uncultured marine virus TaxID=186617 RepID=A0A0F7LB33_9VIRU|nr:hypothetical protein TcasGA2_TC002962 [uncultured marine virus]